MSVDRALRRLERAYRLAWLIAPLGGVLLVWGVVDLIRGGTDFGIRMDLALLVVGAVVIQYPFTVRNSIRRVRSAPRRTAVTPGRARRALASFLGTLAFCAGLGYLVGGVVVAVAFPLIVLAIWIPMVIRWRRARRRAMAAS
jgi:hypothetical protein